MKALSNLLTWYREYRSAKSKSRVYKAVRGVVLTIVVAYVLLLSFPQVLFAHQVSYKNFTVYSRKPLDSSIYVVLDRVDSKLATSPINNPEVKPRIFLTDSHRLYKGLSLMVGGNSFGKGFPVLPTSNIFISRTDVHSDLVFRDARENNQRSLSGVIAHEITHLHLRRRFGYLQSLTFPTWKREGFCEYVAGGSTLPFETGMKLWRANPENDTGYQYFKYYMVVKYLLEQEKLSVDELFNRDIDLRSIEGKVLNLQTTATKVEQLRVISYSGDLAYLLAAIPVNTRFTIGFQVDPRQPPMQQIKIQLYDVTLREIMNAVVQERPEYEWNGNDDTIDISPAGQSSALLDVMINAFEVNDLDSSAAIDKLMNLPEVQQAMRTLNLRNAKATRKQVDRDVKKFSLNLHDVTLRQALHSIARASETQFWILRKSKDNPSTFSVSTSPGQ